MLVTSALPPVPHPVNEMQRVQCLGSTGLLDSPAAPLYDKIVRLAQSLYKTPIALVSFVDSHRQWFKARIGIDISETPRDISFCGHTILQEKVFVIENAAEHSLFKDNPLVTGAPGIRFYAGASIVIPDGLVLGTLCIADTQPRYGFGEDLQEQLQLMAGILADTILERMEHSDSLLS